MKMKWILMAFTAVMLAAPVAMAEEPYKPAGERHKRMMEKIDADKDGKVSKAEFTSSYEDRFAKADADADGFLTEAEMKAAWEKMSAEREARRAAKDEAKGETRDGTVVTTPMEAAPPEAAPSGEAQ